MGEPENGGFPLWFPFTAAPKRAPLKEKTAPNFTYITKEKALYSMQPREIMHTAILDKITGTGVGWYETFTYIT